MHATANAGTPRPSEMGESQLAHRAMGRGGGQQTALRRFAASITLLTVVGHAFLGFEQSYLHPLLALATAYPMQLLLEWLYARSHGMRPKFAGGFGRLVDFLLPAHIAALSIAMLLYFNDRFWIVAFAVAVAIGSKSILRVPVRGGTRHFFNPSNLAISVTFLAFPSVGLTMPWQWTMEVSGIWDWLFPVAVFGAGFMLHLKHAARIWVVLSFFAAFVAQALVRSLLPDQSLLSMLAPATGVPAMIFVFYMAPDPATSPAGWKSQVVFGTSIAIVYMFLVLLHIVFALFFALTIVCGLRGIGMVAAYIMECRRNRSNVPMTAC